MGQLQDPTQTESQETWKGRMKDRQKGKELVRHQALGTLEHELQPGRVGGAEFRDCFSHLYRERHSCPHGKAKWGAEEREHTTIRGCHTPSCSSQYPGGGAAEETRDRWSPWIPIKRGRTGCQPTVCLPRRSKKHCYLRGLRKGERMWTNILANLA